MWCDPNGSTPKSLFSPERLRELFGAAAEIIEGSDKQSWDAQMTFLRSPTGADYDSQLFERFEAVRKKRDER